MTRGDAPSTGRSGEDLAAAYLLRQGCEIVARNWLAHPGEIDVVARCPSPGPGGPTLAFVEVRTRHGRVGLAEESISPRKAASMTAAAYAYMAAHDIDPEAVAWRIDLLAIAAGPGGAASVNWLKGALDESALDPRG